MNLLTIMAMSENWMFKYIRSIAMSIDTVIYGFMERVYELLIMISEAGIFSQATIQTFANRIYVFLGLVMIFRVSISLINYIINPSNFNDKAVGGPALVKNIAFVLVGIVLIPYVFEAAYGLQRIILKDNVIGNLILGMSFDGSESKGSDSTDNAMSTEDKDASYYAEHGGKIIAFQIFSSFFTFNNQIASPTCINQPVNSDGSFNTEACGADKGIQGVPFDSGIEGIDNAGDYIAFAYKSGDFRTLANADLSALVYKSTNGDYPLFDYYFLPSAIIGIAVIILLLSFCIDIAVRSVKLGFLQLIAPVPLIMRIDPKNGKTKFDNWVKECTSTYLDLFTRLAALYFTIFIIAAIAREGIQNIAGSANNVQSNIFVKVFIIIGALLFAKQLPQLIYDIIGGKKDSMGTSKFKSALAGGAVGAGLAGGMMLGANGWAFARNAMQNKRDGKSFTEGLWGHSGGIFGAKDGEDNGRMRNALHNINSMWANTGGLGVGGAVAGAARGLKGGYKAGSIGKAMGAATAARNLSTAQREIKKTYADQSYGIGDRIKDKLDIASGVSNSYASSGHWSEDYQENENRISDLATQENEMYRQMANLQSEYIGKGGNSDLYNSMLATMNPNDEGYDPNADINYKYGSFDDFVNDYAQNDSSYLDTISRYDNEISNAESVDSGWNYQQKQQYIKEQEDKKQAYIDDYKNQLGSGDAKDVFNRSHQLGRERSRLNNEGQRIKKQQGKIDKIRNSTPNSGK